MFMPFFPKLVKGFLAEIQVAPVFGPAFEHAIHHFVLKFSAAQVHETSF